MAGGSTREKTLAIVDRIQRGHNITAMAHRTCVNTTASEIRDVLAQARALGIRNILALRGDPPSGVDRFVKTDGGFEYSYQLVRCIREFGSFAIGVAGFPEGHIDPGLHFYTLNKAKSTTTVVRNLALDTLAVAAAL